MEKLIRKSIAGCLIGCMLFSGCASSGHQYTGQQKQQMETNTIDGSYNNVFNATRTVFLNSGLVLQQVEMNSGFIRGVIDIEKKPSKWRFTWFLLGLIGVVIFCATQDGAKGHQEYDITATLVDLKNNSVEVRLQTPLLEKQSNQYGLALKRIFAEIKKQTLILEAAGRT